MNKTAKIYTAGHQGLVGSALVPNLQAKGHTKLLTRTHAELDLTNQAASEAFFAQEQPDFVNAAAKELGMQIRWKGQGVEEKGYLISFPFKGEAGRGMGEPGEAPHSPSPPAGKGRGEGAPGPRHSRESGTPDRPIVAVDPRYFRPTEVETLLGDAAKAKEKLGWTPKIRFQELVAEMVREDLKSAERDELVKKHGYAAFDYNE